MKPIAALHRQCRSWVRLGSRAGRRRLLLYPEERKSGGRSGTSVQCRYCCKSRKSDIPKILAKVDLRTSLPLHRFL